jgi:predicted alpha/beta superfamily hydrolase
MKSSISLAFFLVLFLTSHAQTTPLNIGEIHTLSSNILEEERTINIHLPATYDSTKSYPVIYLLDGSINEDFLHVCGLEQFFNLQFKMPEFIIVGIANIDRKRDFTFPTEIEDLKKDYPTTGHSAAFIRFLEEELKPYIEQHFPTNGTNYLIGQSLGGLLATEVLLRKAPLFTHYLIVSPSLWWDDQSLLDEADSLIQQQNFEHTYVYVSVGEKEHPIMVKDAKRLFKVLSEINPEGIRLDFNLMKKENHATILHNSIYEAFLGLFPPEED